MTTEEKNTHNNCQEKATKITRRIIYAIAAIMVIYIMYIITHAVVTGIKKGEVIYDASPIAADSE